MIQTSNIIHIYSLPSRWFMKPQHTNAEEGLQIAQDVRAAVSIGGRKRCHDCPASELGRWAWRLLLLC